MKLRPSKVAHWTANSNKCSIRSAVPSFPDINLTALPVASNKSSIRQFPLMSSSQFRPTPEQCSYHCLVSPPVVDYNILPSSIKSFYLPCSPHFKHSKSTELITPPSKINRNSSTDQAVKFQLRSTASSERVFAASICLGKCRLEFTRKQNFGGEDARHELYCRRQDDRRDLWDLWCSMFSS